MRKAFLGVMAAAVILSLGSTSAFAAGPGGGRCFVNADGDRICDNAGGRCAYVDADDDGICDNCQPGRGCGRGGQGGHGNGFRGGRGR